MLTTVALGLVVVAAVMFGTQAAQPGSSAARTFSDILLGRDADRTADPDRPVTEDDGVMPDGVDAADERYAGIANLDLALLQALRAASVDAADDGIELFINDGWRSSAYQDRLLREAISTYGSEEEARRWVATPESSAHVSGDAVDIGPFDAMVWLSEHGADYGLCQIYVNEPWHYELRPEAIDQGCPSMYADPTEDPRMQR